MCCADVLAAQGHREDSQRHFSDAEVMTVPLVAALFYAGNHALTRRFLHQHSYTHTTLSASRFCRRLAQVLESAWQMVFALLSQVFQARNREQVYAIDSYPVAVCANCRINRCAFQSLRLVCRPDPSGLARLSSQQKAILLRLQSSSSGHCCLVIAAGEPIEFFISQGSLHDLEGLKRLPLDVPAGATLFGDKAYKDAEEEWLLQDAAGVRFLPLTRRNAKIPLQKSRCRPASSSWLTLGVKKSKPPLASSTVRCQSASTPSRQKDFRSSSKPLSLLTPSIESWRR
jgi:hypothetical protein